MSSQSSQELVLKAFEAGAKDYLIKPVRRNELATLWQHVWRVNRDLVPANGHKSRLGPSKVKQFTGTNNNHHADVAASPLHLLCEVASNEHQANRLLAQAGNAPENEPSQLHHRNDSYRLSPVELEIQPLDVTPSHPAATRAAPHNLDHNTGPLANTHHSMPAALRELAALGNKLEKERSKQQPPRSSDEDEQGPAGSDAANALHHSESTSPFQSFTAFVPRPCSRGDAGEPASLNPPSALQQLSLGHDPARDSSLVARLSGHAAGVTAGQQHQFFQAFQAAVEQHQLALEACAVNRRAAIAKFREKRKARNFNKKVPVHCCCQCMRTDCSSASTLKHCLAMQGVCLDSNFVLPGQLAMTGEAIVKSFLVNLACSFAKGIASAHIGRASRSAGRTAPAILLICTQK